MSETKAKKITMVPVVDIQESKTNRNKHSKEQIDRLCKLITHYGFREPMIISNRSGFLVAGHGRLQAAKKLGLKTIPVVFQDFKDEDEERTFGISTNAIASWAELDLEGINLDLTELGPMDIDLLGIKDFTVDLNERDLSDDDIKKYTKKIERPIYEPNGDRPDISDLYNTEKAEELIREIEVSSVSKEEKEFLRFAACRHAVIDFQNVAEFYCHSSEEFKKLAEKSALVIIDFDAAIENGFVELTKSIAEAAGEETD